MQTATAAANTNVSITLTSDGARRTLINYLAWSYDGAPTAGRLTIENGSGNIEMDIDITAAGPGELNPQFLASDKDTDLIITLYAAGAGVSGKLSVDRTTHPAPFTR